MEPTHAGWVFVKGKGFFQKWKKNFGAVYPKTQFGVERLEIYPSEHDFMQAKHDRTVLLGNCISVRYVDSGNSQLPFAVQVTINDAKSGHVLLATNREDQAQDWQEALCRAAFPDQYAKVSGPLKPNGNFSSVEKFGSPGAEPSESAQNQQQTDDYTYDTPWDVQQVRVLLIPTESSQRLGLNEGAYDLSFGTDGVILKSEGNIVEAWNYKLISWFGYGSSACCFETERNQTFEFKCARPDFVYERLRDKIRLKASANRQPPGLKQVYYAHYAPSALRNEEAQRRTIFAPRASIDTALPGIYAVPNTAHVRESVSPILPISPKETKENSQKWTKTKSLPQGVGLSKKDSLTGSPESTGVADVSETSFVKRKSRFRSFFSSKRGKKHKKRSDASNSSGLSDERVEDWTFKSGDEASVGEPLTPEEAPLPPVPEKSVESYLPKEKPPTPPRQQQSFPVGHQEALIEQLNRRLAERKETAGHMPPPFPPLKEEPEDMEDGRRVMPDVVDVNFRRSVSDKPARLRDSVTSEPGNGSPRFFSVRNATPSKLVPASTPVIKETTFESPAQSPVPLRGTSPGQARRPPTLITGATPVNFRYGPSRSGGNVGWRSGLPPDQRHSTGIITDV